MIQSYFTLALLFWWLGTYSTYLLLTRSNRFGSYFAEALSSRDGIGTSRRRLIVETVGAFTTATAVSLPVSSSSATTTTTAATNIPKSVVGKDQTVLVLGANGLTGRECVASVLTSGRPCVATSRSNSGNNFLVDGNNTDPTKVSFNSPKLSYGVLDVTNAVQVDEVIRSTPNLGAVIFAASVSAARNKQQQQYQQSAFDVDRDGVIHAAESCITHKVPRYVVISSGTVTRPDSAVYQLLNIVGKGIMEAKIQGEDQVRALYSQPNVLSQGLGYTIIRPGGLTTGEPLGVTALELNQGDTKSGRLSRADVAAVCINALDSTATWDTTFELYERLTAKPIESVGLSNILKQKGESTFVSGFEQRGSTWSELFQGLAVDPGHDVLSV
jgi:uncharacterized protein YbjT (DUF2867 family)